MLAADKVQDRPVTHDDLLVEELNGGVADPHRGRSEFIGIFAVKEVSLEFLPGELVGGLGVKFGKKPDFPQIALLGAFRHTGQLQSVGHFLTKY